MILKLNETLIKLENNCFHDLLLDNTMIILVFVPLNTFNFIDLRIFFKLIQMKSEIKVKLNIINFK